MIKKQTIMKKVLFSVLTISAMFAFASCGGSGNSTGNDSVDATGVQAADPPITFQSLGDNHYIDVPLDGCFEVQKVSAEVVPGEEYGDIGKKQINVTMKIKLAKAYPMKISLNNWLTRHAKLQLLNENETVVETISVEVDPIMGLTEGGVGIITGHTDEDGGSVVEEKFNKVKYIRLSEVKAVTEKERSGDTSDSEDSSDETSMESSSTSDIEGIASSQMKTAEKIAQKQMEEAERIAKKQMEDAENQAKKMMGL